MQDPKTDLLNDVADYYSAKLATHGQTPKGVDWNGSDGQTLRFVQLCKIIDLAGEFSINDLGCGYGALFDFLAIRHTDFNYFGNDISDAMIHAATHRHLGFSNASFFSSAEPLNVTDYAVASGVLNVKLSRTNDEWRAYVESVLDLLDRSSQRGFSFNCLTSYSDAERMQDHLYYANPGALFDLCKRRYSKSVALLHDYGLYEFTILVRKQP